ncbi:hypothetical protein [Actinacidiphila yeochonensis]|uniref:hypothetical protein n=1 Tax=Actinacidiphila yeochonensis TaxID=89050 RepID=UPI00056BDCAB|nr:hypothetical protein [Actinacidiphila yeochonensis]
MDARRSPWYDQPLPRHPGTRRRPADALASWAVATGVAVLVLALALPIETVDSDRAGVQPRDSLYQAHGPLVLLPAGVPLLVAALVAVLVRACRRGGRGWALPVAWALSGLLLGTAVAGFLTFLIGVFVMPTGLLLVTAAYQAQRERLP